MIITVFWLRYADGIHLITKTIYFVFTISLSITFIAIKNTNYFFCVLHLADICQKAIKFII
ncbi:hypothetical protein CHC58_05085 [Salmonella enterica]|nr:hypothetical protein CHC58_05085 [Salmonella enterica]